MLPQKSLRAKFVLQLVSASAMLIVIFSVMLYHYIKITIFESVVQELTIKAQSIVNSGEILELGTIDFYYPDKNDGFLRVEENSQNLTKPKFIQIQNGGHSYLNLYYPYFDNLILNLQKDTTQYFLLVSQVLADIIIVNATAIFLVLFYAMFLSRMLLVPIKVLAANLSKLNENFLHKVNSDDIPTEFRPLGESINRLIDRIQTFAEYQKELFIGAAHELKTPLAVMKTKNEVTLIKPRESEKYVEALKSNNDAINQMNKMISSILEIGRQEGAQFEKPVKIDIIKHLSEMSNNFKMLARLENKDVETNLTPNSLFLTLQPSLLTHVIQNFVQNAIKFSPVNSRIQINSYAQNGKFKIEVIDCGCGIDESKDLFAPFKRYGDKGGAGLGLFLAKGAAQALGGKVLIKNRSDVSGAIATLTLPLK